MGSDAPANSKIFGFSEGFVLAPDKSGSTGSEPFLSGGAKLWAGKTAFVPLTMKMDEYANSDGGKFRPTSRRHRICNDIELLIEGGKVRCFFIVSIP